MLRKKILACLAASTLVIPHTSASTEMRVIADSFAIQLFGTETLYDAPDATSATVSLISPQEVVADSYTDLSPSTGRHRAYRIQTWLGPKWIIPQHEHIPFLRGDPFSLELDGATPIYDRMADLSFYDPEGLLTLLPMSGYLAPQTVQVLQTYNPPNIGATWHLIQTWLGPKWITTTVSTKGTAGDAIGKHALTRVTAGHLYPFDSAPVVFTLAPQQVESIAVMGDWAKIRTTYAGEGWVRVKDRSTSLDDAEFHKYWFDATDRIIQDVEKRIVMTNASATRAGVSRFNMNSNIVLLQSPYENSNIQADVYLVQEDGSMQPYTSFQLKNMRVGELRPLYINKGGIDASKVKLEIRTVQITQAEK